ncbi:hypothetical protein CABS01_12571 [Colletotrichum abscissum]|uniref:uncharacterized protein n=1 Tax=Colletotrichum abscissum TaxID=1671311 RepID=UPI0027D4C92A|nr:uncharacterized protein CABS01_12571 [Colletotrichum abscissum]KAK1489990.1 hypothetical protein CABS01_12571 [Colletotrichum abscissum]
MAAPEYMKVAKFTIPGTKASSLSSFFTRKILSHHPSFSQYEVVTIQQMLITGGAIASGSGTPFDNDVFRRLRRDEYLRDPLDPAQDCSRSGGGGGVTRRARSGLTPASTGAGQPRTEHEQHKREKKYRTAKESTGNGNPFVRDVA